jgi:hypothetical protein
MRKTTKHNLFIKSAKWAATFNLKSEVYDYTGPSTNVHIHVLKLNEDISSVEIKYLSCLNKKTIESSLTNLYNQICKFFKEKGIKLSYAQARKITLALEELKK